jgi:hypothetical protein
MRRLLAPEIGLPDTRRGRRWLAIFHVVAAYGCAQEIGEAATWTLLALLDGGVRRSRERRVAAATDEIRWALGGGQEAADRLAAEVEQAHRETA